MNSWLRILTLGRALAVAAALAFALGGCGLFPEVKDETASWSADRLYQTAHEAMMQGNYTRAIKLFDQLEARFPYGRYAQQAILE
jgi:outer membrane protein assembly factor BamD